MATIRLAQPSDAKGILQIYAPYIRDTSFTFETDVPSIADFEERISSYLTQWPWLVCEHNGVIAGYAYGSKYRERTGYQWCVETSVYIHDDFQRTGAGAALYTAVFDILRRQGYHNVYAVINLPNPKSVEFHEKMGFSWFATYKNVGYKLGKWKDVGWWQLQLNEYGHEPQPPASFDDLSKEFLPDLFRSLEKKLRL